MAKINLVSKIGDRPRFKPVSKNENLGQSLIFHAIAF